MSEITIQNEVFESIKRLCANYQKDGASRKVKEYLTQRLVSLENLWQDFDNRHKVLLEREDKGIQYFTGNIYEKTKHMYESTRADILQRLLACEGKQAEVVIPHPTGVDTKTKELLDRQECHIKALERAMSKIEIDSITEKWELEDHLSVLKTKWDAVEKCHWELEAILKGSNEVYNDLFGNKERQYDIMKRSLNSKLWTSANYQNFAPRIQLPEFTGHYSQWITFKDMFLETIHNNANCSKAQKMQHLKSKLKGEPERLVQHLVGAENYETCWDILIQRYDNKRLQFTNLMNTLMQLPTNQQASAAVLKKMHDVINECINGLHNIGLNTSSWDPIIVYLMAQKLDTTSYTEYTRELQHPKEVPELGEFLGFLETKFMALEAAKGYQKDASNQHKQTFSHKTRFNSHKPSYEQHRKEASRIYHTSFGKCLLCSGLHVIMQCPKFIEMDTRQRNDTVRKLQICKNCLYKHSDTECTSNKTCKDCNKPHHTMLHYSTQKLSPSSNLNNTFQRSQQREHQPSTSTNQYSTNHLSNDYIMEILLTTVELQVKTSSGDFITLRALLDQGSQVNLITENAAQRLKLPRKRMNATISGVGSILGDCKGRLELECKSRCTDFAFSASTLVMKRITNNLPNKTFKRKNWPQLQGLKLADPDFNLSRTVDLLLGADIYSQIILEGVLKGDAQTPTAQETRLGWILCGKVETFNCHVALVDLNDLKRFWETEDIIQNTEDTSKDDWCENYYKMTTERERDGKYIVKMPLVPGYEEKLGNSKPIAISQFLQLERKFNRKPKLASMYKDFIRDYIDLGHMKLSDTASAKDSNFLPHHGVLREQSTTTKLRAVFNASQKTMGGCSLNDVMEKGPNLQKDIQALILQWRGYKYVYTADIEKMYRSIWCHPDQQHLQKIIWRNQPTENLREYQLQTLTYGTKSAPWLAMRTLKQLAFDDGHKYPKAAEILLNQFYVDDLISGHNSTKEAKEIQTSIIKLLKGGGMNLRKWSSNNPELLRHLDEDQISKSTFDFKGDESMKTLGLSWNPKDDVFIFNWTVDDYDYNNELLTKRKLLSQISRLYDPLGWLAPITVSAKLLFQRVWLTKINWDAELPNELQDEWRHLNKELHLIKNIKINRWIGSTQKTIQLHGFCDASEKAYACVIYSRVIDEKGDPRITLLVSKTRVVPITQTTSLPRLELCGALLLSQLMEKVKNSLTEHEIAAYGWCDSKVVLAWIQGDPSRWERYVANRVGKIKDVIPPQQWCYVRSELNPADCASRGLLPSKVVKFNLWWHGPMFLKNFAESETPHNVNCHFTTSEARRVEPNDVRSKNYNTENIVYKLLKNHSSLTSVTRITARIVRYFASLKQKLRPSATHLTTTDLQYSAEYIIKYVQQSEFAQEHKQLKQNKTVSPKSSIYKLKPYLDNKGIIRVGGRLQHSDLPANMKNPAVVPYSSRFTELLIDQAHLMTLHGGARLTLTYIRQRYWIVSGNRAVKGRIRRCVKCHRYNSTDNAQIMADLPKQRVTPSRPFTHTGVDFTGHVDVKLNKGRGVKTSKAYIAVFVCMATKAVHIELVSELSTEAFIAALQRMCARRGTPAHMYSDNGTNFVGASKVLREDFSNFKKLLSPEFFDEIGKLEIQWHFNAPAWPSAGGIFEAAVKSLKHHLRRVLGDQKLTWEEFTTLLAKIEACLNSRPLCPLTEDPEEFYTTLTPGHFLTGSATLSLPQPEPDDRKMDLRKRWQLTEHMLDQFWKAWSNDYLNTLQSRSKWNKTVQNLKPNDVVLIKETNLPPGKWAMGRVMETHPGKDGLVRVATLKTKTGVIKRPTVKLTLLPQQEKLPATEETTNSKREEDTEITKNQRRKRSTRTNKYSFLTFTLITLIGMIGTAQSSSATNNYKVTSIINNQPIYFDEAGKLQLIHDEWTLLIYYNLTSYWQATNNMNYYINQIDKLCQRIAHEFTPCEAVVNHLRHEMHHLENYNTMLLSQHSRHKRGYFDGIGKLARTLFGVLDEDFAQKYEKDIQNMQTNDNYLLQLMKNQTLIIEAENNVIKNNTEFMDKQFHAIQTYINQTCNIITKIENKAQILYTANDVTSAALSSTLILSDLHRIQEMLMNALANIYRGHLDTHLFPASQIIEQLNIISGKLPQGLTLPIKDTQKDFRDIYELIHVKARITNNFLLFELHIPLLSDEDYKIYRVIPIPFQKQGQLKVVQPFSNYIAINFVKNSYITMEEQDMRQCTPYGEDEYTCISRQPVFSLQDKDAPCEAKVFNQQTSVSCVINNVTCKETWIKLHKPNWWLFTLCDRQLMRVICSDQVTPAVINGTGVIALKPKCILQKKDATIFTYNHLGSKFYKEADIEVPILNTTINNLFDLSWKNAQLNMTELDTSKISIKNIDRQITQQKEQERLPQTTEISSHDIYLYSVTSLLLGAAASFAVYIWIRRLWHKKPKKPSTRQPAGIDNKVEIEMQEIRHSTPPEPLYSDARPKQLFHFEEQ